MRLVCNEGYKPKAGISVVKCTTNSSFDYFTLPSFGCEPITCLDPVNPKNGQMRLQGVYVGDKAIFECNSGYNLIGSAEWTCLSNGKWDATCARCESKDSRSHCPAPCIPLGADVISVEDTFSVGSVLEFVCKSGGRFFGGSKERTCMRNGKWSGTPIDCTGESLYDGNVGMTLLNALEEQIPDNNTDEEVDAVASKTINVGRNGGVDVYFLVDVSRSITNEKFSATKRFINAILPVLGINDGETGTRLAVYYFASKSKKMYKDHFHEEPYVSYIEAQELISATHIDEVRNQTGSGTAITSVLEDIKQDLLTKRVNINKGVYRQAQQVIILLSDGVFTTAGSPIKTAEDLKTSFEVEIYSIFVGDVIDDKVGFRTMEEIASKKENEEHFFAITNRDNFDDVLDKMIRGAVNLSCGITQEHLTQMKNNSYQDEHNASPHAWPWMAELRSDTEHVCGGSLIEDQWILTAAHCFESKPVTKVHLKKLRLDQQMAFVDTPVDQNDIHLHPKFNKTDKTNKPSHLYDIALIKLQKKFPFSPRLLPVCLWNDNINNETKKNYLDYFADTTFGVATGWGSTIHKGKPENHLKQMQMNVKSHKECIKNLDVNQTKEVDENLMFCAGGSEIVDGIKKNIDVCTGDSGGPFVVEHPTQENKYIQTGIISFGFGCKQDGIYGFYTKLTEELLEWIRNTTASF